MINPKTAPADWFPIYRKLLDDSKANGTTLIAPDWMGGMVENGNHRSDWTPSQFVDGEHFLSHIGTFKRLKREGKIEEAEALLWELCQAVETVRHFIPPAYHHHLSIVLAKQRKYEEAIAILQRYDEINGRMPNHWPPSTTGRIAMLERQRTAYRKRTTK